MLNGASEVKFAQLPDEESAFLSYLAMTGDVWARAVADDPTCNPAPVTDFITAHSDQLMHNGMMRVYVGLRPDVLTPARREDGTVDLFKARLVGYRRGGYYPSGELAQSILFFFSESLVGNQFVAKPVEFLTWAGKVLDWARRYTPEEVPVHGFNCTMRATVRVIEAAAGGLKVRY